MAFVSKDLLVESLDDVNWRLHREVVYRDGNEVYRVPEGYVTDFASVPRATAWLYPRTGAYSAAAVVHDWLITDLLPSGDITSTHVDEVFRNAMKELGVPFARRWVMWAGVRLGAIANPARRRGSLRTLPLVLLVMLASSPVILPPSIVVQTMVAVLWVVGLVMPSRQRVNSQKT